MPPCWSAVRRRFVLWLIKIKCMDRSEIIKWVWFAGIILLTFFLFWKFYSVIRSWFGSEDSDTDKKQEEELMEGIPDSEPLPPETGGVIRKGFDPMPTAASLHKVLTETYYLFSSARVRCETCQRAMDLSGNELLLVYDAYKNNYKQSLKRALMDVNISGCRLFEENAVEALRKRLEDLGKA